MESGMSQATREIMWNIPPSFKYAMYGLLLISLAVMFKGVLQKISFATNGKGVWQLKKAMPSKLMWAQFLKTIFLTGKVPRVKKVAIFHNLIFYGFFILWIATDLVAIHYDTPFKIFHGTLYKVISFLADFAGVAILVGLALAFKRRYISRPAYLSSTRPKEELFMYAMLSTLVLIGFAIEGFRILGNNMPIGEKSWAPIGWGVALAFKSMNMTDGTLAIFYRGLWFFHMVNTMAFIISLGHTKFFHIFILPFQALITPPRRGGVMLPMDFENEDAETFGLGKLSELTTKNRLDLLACVECGRCTNVCPANNAGRPLNPKTIITKIRDFAFQQIKAGENEGDLWDKQILNSRELDSCTTCGACMEECPANIEHVSLIMEAKRYKTLTLGEIPAAAADAVNKVKVNGNPWGISQDDRFKWADGLDVPVIEVAKKVDYLYYIGCAGSYDAGNQKVAQDTVRLLQKAGVDFAVMGKMEKCCGDPVRRFGDDYSFQEIAIENIENMNKYDFNKVITHCPHCLHTIGKEYGKFEGGDYTTLHHSEVLADLLSSGKLVPTKKLDGELTFHDPCYLGRHHNQYNAPRAILQATGVTIKEMEQNKEKALCCGMGGGNMWYEMDEGENIADKRLQHVGDKEVQKLATACSFCMINFNSSKSEKTKTENIEIEDVSSLLAKATL